MTSQATPTAAELIEQHASADATRQELGHLRDSLNHFIEGRFTVDTGGQTIELRPVSRMCSISAM